MFGDVGDHVEQLRRDFGELKCASRLTFETTGETRRWMKMDSEGTGRYLAGCSGWIAQTSRTQCVSSPRHIGTATNRFNQEAGYDLFKLWRVRANGSSGVARVRESPLEASGARCVHARMVRFFYALTVRELSVL